MASETSCCVGLIPKNLIAFPSSCADIDLSLFVSNNRNNSRISVNDLTIFLCYFDDCY